MTVQVIWTPDGLAEVTGTGYAPDGVLRDRDGAPVTVDANAALRWSLLAGAFCNDAALTHDGRRWDIVGDPTEGAMLVAVAKAGLDRDRLAAKLPPAGGDSVQLRTPIHGHVASRRWQRPGRAGQGLGGADARAVQHPDGRRRYATAAGPRRSDADGRDAVRAGGLRVLATGGVRSAIDPEDFQEGALGGSLTLTGLQAMLDPPPRAAATSAVAACQTAGIAVKMITGDHAGTAASIATKVGLFAGANPCRARFSPVLTSPR